jgi:hypothetical protein
MNRHSISIALAALVFVLAVPQWARAADGDLRAGLSHLRAGDQVRAEQELTKYRNAEPDAGVRSTIDRILPLLKRPLPGDVREYLARTVEDAAAFKVLPGRSTRSFVSRVFPVFP